MFASSPIANDMMGLERTDLHYVFEEAEHDGTASALVVYAEYDSNLLIDRSSCLFGSS